MKKIMDKKKINVRVIRCNSIEEFFKHMFPMLMNGKASEKQNKDKKVGKNRNPITLRQAFESLAKRMKCSVDDATAWLNNILNVNKAAALAILLKEIAILLDKKYVGHISECDKVFIFSMFDGRLHVADTKAIKTYDHFAAFRTAEDAKYAYGLLHKFINTMFPNEGY